MAVLAWLVRPHATESVSWQRGAVIGGLFATAWLTGTFWWLFISMHTYGGLAAPLAVAAVLGLAAFLASYYAAMLGIFCRLALTSKALTAIIFGASRRSNSGAARAEASRVRVSSARNCATSASIAERCAAKRSSCGSIRDSRRGMPAPVQCSDPCAGSLAAGAGSSMRGELAR